MEIQNKIWKKNVLYKKCYNNFFVHLLYIDNKKNNIKGKKGVLTKNKELKKTSKLNVFGL